MNLPPPQKSIAKVLLALIERTEIKERDFQINSFRSIISDLKNDYGIPIRHYDKRGRTEFGKTIVYRVHYLWFSSRKKAEKIYLKINQG